MVKQILSILLFLGCSIHSIAQISSSGLHSALDSVAKEVLDYSLYQVQYEYKQQRDKKDTFNVISHEMLLFIGHKYLRYTDKYSYHADTLVDNAYKRGVKNFMDIMAPAMSLGRRASNKGNEVYTNLVQRKSKNRQSVGVDNYVYEEALPQQEWQLTEGDSTILGYACKRAETSFRGRKYVAWYAPELELPYGPWKFGGLPGLIFDVVDSEGEHRHTLRGLKATSGYTPIYWKPSQPRRTKTGYTREEVWKIAYNYAKDPAAYLRQLEGIRFEEKDLQEMKPRPYNPQELE